ncbi:MAG TPA: excinuclease ABC subunit UvrA [Saprospiraceae bacterium]|nr:excinuclease ABC subunit UvrA [Saprospiraceae bacterium]
MTTKPPFIQSPLPVSEAIEVIDAYEHNLKHLDVYIPRDKLVVITGISGSGKSSLAFDTIYAEGQRRYIETFDNYTRMMIGGMERPAVEKINGLNPVISIEQKTTGWNPRSTLGTVTEVYDLLRLLYARIGEAYSYINDKKMVKFSEEEILENLLQEYDNEQVLILAPVVKGRKGHYKELFDQVRKQGYTKIMIDGIMQELTPGMQVDRYKIHDIELLIDKIKITANKTDRLRDSLTLALKMGEGLVFTFIEKTGVKKLYSKHLADPENGLAYDDPSPNTFSFNSPYGACPRCDGLGELYKVDFEKIIPDGTRSINDGGIVALGSPRETNYFTQLRKIARQQGFTFALPIDQIPKKAMQMIMYGERGTSDDLKKPSVYNEYTYDLKVNGLSRIIEYCYTDTTSEKIRQWAEDFMSLEVCPECNGDRLKKESLHYRINGINIATLNRMPLKELGIWFEKLPGKINKRQQLIGAEIIKELNMRLHFLNHVGLDYLTLNRTARTLSGGESQRARLANQIGSQLTGVLYILDEPSIGLHQRDNDRLINALRELVIIGNTVLVVEHDKEIMLSSDYIIDIGPGAGKHGGKITGAGTPAEFLKQNNATARYLSGKINIEIPQERRPGNGNYITLTNCSGHNLKNVTVQFPLGKLILVTGVSGSGKSSLVTETLYPILKHHIYHSLGKPLAYESISGLEYIDKVIEIDQAPIGRSPRSNPVTYINVFSEIRNLYALLPESKVRGYKVGRFSFNVAGGRCSVCEGAGMKVIEMNFLPDVSVPCEACRGKRYNRETLEILYKGKSIGDVLEMTVDEAVEFFQPIPKIYRKLKTLQEVGLGYISLGQPATTLSGGEAQRIKLSEELSKRDTGSTFYILDEPTTGLHFSDIQQLLKVIQSLVDKGNTVLIIEHNLDMIKCADHIIDIGPEGGHAGGSIVAKGSPEEVAANRKSITGKYLKSELKLQQTESKTKKNNRKKNK